MQETSVHSKIRQDGSYTLDFVEPLPTPIFENLRSAILCLPEEEIDALSTFYSGLDATRRAIRDERRALNADMVLRHMHHDLLTAEEVARKIWPTRELALPGGQRGNLADKLKEQAATVAKALSQ